MAGLPGAQLLSSEAPGLRDLLMGGSFFYSRAVDAEHGEAGWLGQWSAWGETAATRFGGADGAFSIDGEMSTATLGVDSRWGRWQGGLALAYSEGEGAYTQGGPAGGAVRSEMTGLHPFARYEFSDRTSVWGVVGYGVGGLKLTPEGAGTEIDTELTTTMAAFGGRGVVSRRSGGFELSVVSDARMTETVSESAPGLMGAAGAASRARVLLEGTGAFTLPTGGVLRPTLEGGLRYDGGDAETGAGLELSAGLGYESGRMTVEVSARGLVAHEDTEYEEWGVSGSIAFIPDSDGRGLSMRLGSAWGQTRSGVQSLWAQPDVSGLAGGAFDAAHRFETELGYGVESRNGRGLWFPYVGTQSAEGQQAVRMGLKFTSGPNVEGALELGRDASGPEGPRRLVLLRGSVRF